MPTLTFNFTVAQLTEVKGAVASDLGVPAGNIDDAGVQEWMSAQVRTIVMSKRRTDAMTANPPSASNLPI